MRRPSIIAIGLTAAVAIGHAQTATRDGASPPVPTGTAILAGNVIDGDGKPLRRAAVSIAGDMRLNRTAITNDAGRFSFARLPAGRFTITARKAGYPPMSFGARRPYRAGSGVLLRDAQHVSDIVLTLPRGAVISGTVYDQHGAPMPGVPIMPWEVRTALSGERTFDLPADGGGDFVTTDDRGMYRVFGLPPGEYTVGTSWFFGPQSVIDVRVLSEAEIRSALLAISQPTPPPGAVPSPGPPIERYNYTPVYYPDSIDPLAAVTLTLGPGEEREGIDIRMQFRPMSRIEGVVIGPDGPAGSARISLHRRSRVRALNSSSFTRNRGDGTFVTASLSPDDYTVMAELQGTAERPPMWASADVTISGPEPVKIRLELQPGMTMTGRLVFQSGTIKPPADLSRVRVSLQPVQGTTATNSIQSSTNAAGEFSITGVTPGRFRVNASVAGAPPPGTPAWSVKSVMADGRDVTDLSLDIARGGTPAVTVTFSDAASELSGLLHTAAGQPVTDFFVIAIAADSQYWGSQSRRVVSARPDGSGRYVFRGLPAGDYRIAVTTDLVPRDLTDTEALKLLIQQSIAVTIGLGEKKTQDIKIGGST